MFLKMVIVFTALYSFNYLSFSIIDHGFVFVSCGYCLPEFENKKKSNSFEPRVIYQHSQQWEGRVLSDAWEEQDLEPTSTSVLVSHFLSATATFWAKWLLLYFYLLNIKYFHICPLLHIFTFVRFLFRKEKLGNLNANNNLIGATIVQHIW